MYILPVLLRLFAVLGVGGLLAAIGFPFSALVWMGCCLIALALYNAWMFQSANALIPTSSASQNTTRLPELSWKALLGEIRMFNKENQQEQQRISDELSRVHAAVDHLPDGIILLDRFHMVIWCNVAASTLHGIAGTRRPIHHFIRHPQFVALLEGKLESKVVQIELPQHSGRSFALELVALAENFIVVTRDVSEQVRIDRMRSDFIANVSHEIRTPLTIVGGFAEALQNLQVSDADRQRYLQMILRQSETMRQLVEDLLTLSRLENSTPSTDETIDIQQLVATAVMDAKGLSGDKHQFEIQVPSPASIKGHQKDLESALRNLLSNAVHYTPAGGKITVQWEDKRLSVQDSGIGIPAEHLPRLTERFYRVDKSRSRDSGGTGLGLAIVKRIATRHGAQLLVESEAGEGSKFTIAFATNH